MNELHTSPPLTGLAGHLIHVGLLKTEVATQIQYQANQQDISFIQYIVKNRILTSSVIAENCAKIFGLPLLDLDKYSINNPETLLNAELIKRYRVIPLKKDNHVLEVGTSDPTDRHTLDALAFYTRLIIVPHLITEDQLDQFIEKYFSESVKNKNLELSFLKELPLEENFNRIQEKTINYEEPLIQFVDHIIQHALHQSASDIHIEPFEIICRIRYRQDGILFEIAEIPTSLAARLVTRLKVMAKLDISERRLPQDGRFQLHNIDIRMNTCPTLFGEKIVLRLLTANKFSLDINQLGFLDFQKETFLKKINQPQGLILVTGPTGSGKTMTLYSALHYLNIIEKNISTIEDPVEIQLNGINQVNINPKINFNFANALRTFLRQDPDVIMVGEIRDSETAEIAMQAAQTGHLVLSTLHTNSAVEALTRLKSTGIATYNIISSISVIIAQRLVRKLCNHCKQAEHISAHSLQEMGFTADSNTKLFRSVGCQYCLQGFQGRIGIYEILPITDAIAYLIMSNANSLDILQQAKQTGFINLREAGFAKVKQGITSLLEINRVILK